MRGSFKETGNVHSFCICTVKAHSFNFKLINACNIHAQRWLTSDVEVR